MALIFKTLLQGSVLIARATRPQVVCQSAGIRRSIFVIPICNLLDLSSTKASSWPFCQGVSAQRNVQLREPDVSSALVQTTSRGQRQGQSVDAPVEPRTLGKEIVFRPTSKPKAHLAFWSV